MIKRYYLTTSTSRGKERKISVGRKPKISIYPNTYTEDFCDFPIEILIDTTSKTPKVIISGSPDYQIIYNDKEITNEPVR